MDSSVSLERRFEYIRDVTEILDFPCPLDKYQQSMPLFWWKNKYSTALPPRGYVWILHGLGEHMGRYEELAVFLTQLGFDVLGIDFPGHGLSRKRGIKNIHSIDDLLICLNGAVDWWFFEGPRSAERASSKDWYLFGHSMGAITGLAWILNAKKLGLKSDFAKAAAVSAPPLKLRLPVPAWKSQVAHSLLNIKPFLELGNEISTDDLSVEVANRAAYREDPLVHGYASPAAFLSILSYAELVKSQSADIEIPLGLMVGENDPIVDPDAVEAFFHSLGTHKKFLKIAGNRHEIVNDIDKNLVFKFIAEWFL